MIPADAERWLTARTLADLGELTALFLEGHIRYSPSHGEPDPETAPLIPVLAACNRAGFVTNMSQPGEPRDEHGSAQRADVSGYATNDAYLRLTRAVAETDLILTAGRALPDERWCPVFTITLDEGEAFTWDGGAESRSDIVHGYGPFCHPDAVEALCAAWQITLIDPVWGRNDVLWPLLKEFADGG